MQTFLCKKFPETTRFCLVGSENENIQINSDYKLKVSILWLVNKETQNVLIINQITPTCRRFKPCSIK